MPAEQRTPSKNMQVRKKLGEPAWIPIPLRKIEIGQRRIRINQLRRQWRTVGSSNLTLSYQ